MSFNRLSDTRVFAVGNAPPGVKKATLKRKIAHISFPRRSNSYPLISVYLFSVWKSRSYINPLIRLTKSASMARKLLTPQTQELKYKELEPNFNAFK
jgi:hypothetical protein